VRGVAEEVESRYAPEEGRVLRRFLKLAKGVSFQCAAVEVRDARERAELVAWLRAEFPERAFVEQRLHPLPHDNLWLSLREALDALRPLPGGFVWVLSGFEDAIGPDPSVRPVLFEQFNVQRDLLVRDLPVTMLLCVHPATVARFTSVAPDFTDYITTWVRETERAEARSPLWLESPLSQDARPALVGKEWPELLVQAEAAIQRGERHAARDLLARFSLSTSASAWELEHATVRASLRELEGDLDGAVDVLERSLAKKAADEREESRYVALIKLGNLRVRQGRYSEAEALLRRVLDGVARVTELRDALRGGATHAIAIALNNLGRYAEAEQLLRESLRIDEIALGKAHPSYGASLHALAGVLRQQGKYTEAEQLLRESLRIKESSLGKAHPSYGASLHELAGVLSQQGKYTEAEELLRESSGIYKRSLGKAHPDYGTSLHELAGVLRQQGKYTEAEQLLRESLRIKESSLGKDHPNLAPTLDGLAQIVFRNGDRAEAERLSRRAVSIERATHGDLHPNVGQALLTLAFLQHAAEHPDARTSAREALAILHATLGPSHPVTRQAAQIAAQIEGGPHPGPTNSLETLLKTAADLARRGRLDDARTLLRDNARAAASAGADAAVASILNLLADVELARGDRDAALAAVDRFIEIATALHQEDAVAHGRALRAEIVALPPRPQET